MQNAKGHSVNYARQRSCLFGDLEGFQHHLDNKHRRSRRRGGISLISKMNQPHFRSIPNDRPVQQDWQNIRERYLGIFKSQLTEIALRKETEHYFRTLDLTFAPRKKPIRG